MEVLHQILIKPLHRSNTLRDREFGNPDNVVENVGWQVHALPGEIVANIGKPCAHVS